MWRITHSKITTRRATYRRSCRTVKRGYPQRAVFRQSAGVLRTPLDPVSGGAGQGLSHFPDLRGRGFAFLVNNTGIEPAIIDEKSIALPIWLIAICPERRARPVVPLLFEQPNPTRLLSGPLPRVSNGVPDFGRRKSPPLPIHCQQALGGKNCLAPVDCPSSSVVDVCLETLRGAKPDRCLSICHPQRERLPSSDIAPQIVNLRSLQDWVCLAVPELWFEAESPGRLPFSLPFDRII